MSATFFPDEALTDRRLTRADTLVFIALGKYFDKNGTCFPWIRTIMQATELARRTVIQSLKKLCELEYLSKEPQFLEDGTQTSNLYKLSEKFLQKVKKLRRSRRVATKPKIKCTPPMHNECTPNTNCKVNDKNKNIINNIFNKDLKPYKISKKFLERKEGIENLSSDQIPNDWFVKNRINIDPEHATAQFKQHCSKKRFWPSNPMEALLRWILTGQEMYGSDNSVPF